MLSLFVAMLTPAMAQTPNDPVLFTVGGTPVYLSEFQYIYTKTNQEKADFSKASLEEYLDLYLKFKLKVRKARDMRIDTSSALREELNGYRTQLANVYLSDREVNDALVREVYQHMQQDVDVSYAMTKCDRNAPAKDTLQAYNRCMNWLNLIRSGKMTFEKIASDSSDDRSARESKGNLGFITAMLPEGYYAFEKAIYMAKPGQLLGPIRSNNGYQIVRVEAFRPARGEMEVGHIMFRKDKNPNAKARIDSVYQALKGGANWEQLASALSDDRMTATNGGYLGFFGISRYQRSFEDAAFALAKDGDFSAPVETTIGWHVIRRLGQRGIQPFETMRRGLTERVKHDSRSEVARQSMIARIQREAKFQSYPEVLQKWSARQQDTIFHTFRWQPDPTRPRDVLIRYGGTSIYTVADFEEFVAQSTRERMRGMGYPVEETIGNLYRNWVDERTISYEESQLENKYPDFKALMREYEEGMMLFEVAKQEVWDKANTDSVGLQKFFDQNLRDKYKWDERAQVTLYSLKTDDAALVEKVRAYAAKKSVADVLSKFNKKETLITAIDKVYEKGKNEEVDKNWRAGALSNTRTDATTKTSNFVKVERMVPPTPKQLSDIRGYAVADYQDYLEKQWVEKLRKEYEVKINRDVLNALIRKK